MNDYKHLKNSNRPLRYTANGVIPLNPRDVHEALKETEVHPVTVSFAIAFTLIGFIAACMWTVGIF